MAYLRLLVDNPSSLKKLGAAKLHFDSDAAEDFDIRETGVRLKRFTVDVDAEELRSDVTVTLGKNLVLVALNPLIGEILGFNPGGVTALTAGYFGQLEFGIGKITPGIEEQLNELDYLCELVYITPS